MKLSLIGAGPGDPELVTLKAINVLKKARVVLYDALVNPALLEYCSQECEKIYVGKKPGIHKYQQIYINDMIVDYARIYGQVVRLKGGDAFVFGRGHEELEHAREHGIDVEIVPGISSSIAVPALNEIPLTKRGVNESFWVITGTTSDLDVSKDIALAAQSSATVIVLMGMSNLSQIMDYFKDSRGVEEPVGIIQNGSRENQKTLFGTVGSIEAAVAQSGIGSPAIIVVGEVVRYGRGYLENVIEHAFMGVK